MKNGVKQNDKSYFCCSKNDIILNQLKFVFNETIISIRKKNKGEHLFL